MAKFVILNFEDDDQGHAPNSTVPAVMRKSSTGAVAVPGHVTGSARSTVEGVAAKARAKETFFRKNVVHHYSGIDLIRQDAAGTLGRNDVAQVRADVAAARKVYIILHGSPDVTEHGFTNAQTHIGWRELSSLALLLFPERSDPYRISLVMCYGARTDNHRLNHLGAMSPGDLKTSFAYKFFRALCNYRNLSLTACTGAVSTQGGDGTNEVETEEWVSATLDVIDYQKDKPNRDLRKDDLDMVKQAYIHSGKGSLADWNALRDAFYTDRTKVANGYYETEIKKYIAHTQHLYDDLQAAKSQAAQMHGGVSNRSKYGRILYDYSGGGVLTIVNKYGDPMNPVAGQNHVLYRGPLL